MKLWAYARSKRALQCVSMAVLLSLAVGVALPTIVRAEDDNSLFSQLFKKKNGGGQFPLAFAEQRRAESKIEIFLNSKSRPEFNLKEDL